MHENNGYLACTRMLVPMPMIRFQLFGPSQAHIRGTALQERFPKMHTCLHNVACNNAYGIAYKACLQAQ
jgi:hypothetical protein